MMKKEEEERKKKNKIDPTSMCMRFDFPTLSKFSGTLQVLLYLDSEVLLVYRFLPTILLRNSIFPLYFPSFQLYMLTNLTMVAIV